MPRSGNVGRYGGHQRSVLPGAGHRRPASVSKSGGTGYPQEVLAMKMGSGLQGHGKARASRQGVAGRGSDGPTNNRFGP